MKTPEVRIYFSWQLNDEVSAPLHGLYAPEGELDSVETLQTYAENYRSVWAMHEAKILQALTDATELEFYKSVIDVPCAPYIRHISDPLMMSFAYSPDQFVDSLTHELCHVLLTDNTTYSINSSEKEVDLNERWSKLFGQGYDFDTLVHIPVHALSKYVYLDVLHDKKRLERDMDDVKDWPAYKAAWDYVTEHDYKNIIEQLKQDFKNIHI